MRMPKIKFPIIEKYFGTILIIISLIIYSLPGFYDFSQKYLGDLLMNTIYVGMGIFVLAFLFGETPLRDFIEKLLGIVISFWFFQVAFMIGYILYASIFGT